MYVCSKSADVCLQQKCQCMSAAGCQCISAAGCQCMSAAKMPMYICSKSANVCLQRQFTVAADKHSELFCNSKIIFAAARLPPFSAVTYVCGCKRADKDLPSQVSVAAGGGDVTQRGGDVIQWGRGCNSVGRECNSVRWGCNSVGRGCNLSLIHI